MQVKNAVPCMDGAARIDAMDWMIIYQDVRRNMCEAEKIYANDKVSVQRIKEENAKKKLEGNSFGGKGGNKVSVQMDADLNIPEKCRDRSTNTREQRAKIAGVSAGTVARYNKVMNSDDEQLNGGISIL